LAGSLAGVLTKTLVFPIDRVKMMYQTRDDRTFSLGSGMRTTKHILSKIGILELWRGNFATCTKIIPYSGVSFSTFDLYHDIIFSYLTSPFQIRVLAGSFCGITACLLTYPFDLLRTQLAAHWRIRSKYNNYLFGICEITRTEGFLGFFKGITPSLIGIIPYSGIQFASFHTIRSFLETKYKKNIPFTIKLISSSGTIFSGLIAQIIVYPLETLRRRQQVCILPRRNMFSNLRHIYQSEGLQKGLFKGLSVNFIRTPVSHAISFWIHDFIKKKIKERNYSQNAIS